MKYLWFFLTACLVGIIYYNSSLPLKQSSEISGWFAALTQLLAQHLDIHLAGDVEHHIRKMAHFCEFALQLGADRRPAAAFCLLQSIGTEKINAFADILPLLLLALTVILCYNFG